MVNEYKNHDCSGNIWQSLDSRDLALKAVQGTEDKALGPWKAES